MGEFARRADLNPRTIEHWEEREILTPEAHGDGGYRLYSEDYVAPCYPPPMPRRPLLLASAGVIALIAVVLIIDALIVTDEEQLEKFSEAISQTIDPDSIQQAMVWVDPSRVPLIVEVRGRSERFEDSREIFGAHARSRLTPFYGTRLHPLSRKIEVEGNRGRVVLDMMSRRGRIGADFDLVKVGDEWLVRHAVIR